MSTLRKRIAGQSTRNFSNVFKPLQNSTNERIERFERFERLKNESWPRWCSHRDAADRAGAIAEADVAAVEVDPERGRAGVSLVADEAVPGAVVDERGLNLTVETLHSALQKLLV